MCTKKEVLIFLAGAETFHAVVHAGMLLFNVPDVTLPWMTITRSYSMFAVALNALIAAGLLYWASKLKR